MNMFWLGLILAGMKFFGLIYLAWPIIIALVIAGLISGFTMLGLIANS